LPDHRPGATIALSLAIRFHTMLSSVGCFANQAALALALSFAAAFIPSPYQSQTNPCLVADQRFVGLQGLAEHRYVQSRSSASIVGNSARQCNIPQPFLPGLRYVRIRAVHAESVPAKVNIRRIGSRGCVDCWSI